MQSKIKLAVLMTALSAMGVVAAYDGLAAADGTPMPTCTITKFEMMGLGGRGVAVEMGTDAQVCFGAYIFIGVTPQQLMASSSTWNNYAELAAALRHWSSLDGVPAVSEWVNLSPSLAAGMREAGINPTMFLQWVNEYDGAGTVNNPAMPSTWPPFLPKALVKDPTRIAGGPMDHTVPDASSAPPSRSPPPPPTSPPPISMTQSPTAPTQAATTGEDERTGTDSTAPAKGPMVIAPLPPVAPSGTTFDPSAPPPEGTTGGSTTPCVVTLTCRDAVKAHDKWQALPWYIKLGLQMWWHRWLEVEAAASVLAGIFGVRAWLIGRRNVSTYGHPRHPRQ